MVFKNSGRYSVPSDEGFEPDSNNEVIKNYLGVKSKEIMDELEQSELKRTELELVKFYGKDYQFKAEDICNIHELWLGDLYPMAGKYREVSMEKGGFLFAASGQIEKLMLVLEKKYLKKYTPCHFTDSSQLAYALGMVHVELILIHPFREGNGRVARLLADLMAAQANMPPLNYMAIDQIENPQGFERYIEAIHAGFNGDYLPIQNIFTTLLQQSV
ncbi:MAG TPA: Fic family protein [Gammaproteobacteria bacterium]|nr:Fic family protein [Gammaproteobacteria bacterium]